MGKFKWVGVYRINVATDINPQEIYAEYKRGLIDRNLAIERITLLIETGKGTYLRAESVEYLGNIKPLGIDIFRLLEEFCTF